MNIGLNRYTDYMASSHRIIINGKLGKMHLGDGTLLSYAWGRLKINKIIHQSEQPILQSMLTRKRSRICNYYSAKSHLPVHFRWYSKLKLQSMDLEKRNRRRRKKKGRERCFI